MRSTCPRRAWPLGVAHCAATGAAVLGLLFLLLWTTRALADPHGSEGMLVFLTPQALRTPGSAARGLGEARSLSGPSPGAWSPSATTP
jgi:hypothetical protein